MYHLPLQSGDRGPFHLPRQIRMHAVHLIIQVDRNRSLPPPGQLEDL